MAGRGQPGAPTPVLGRGCCPGGLLQTRVRAYGAAVHGFLTVLVGLLLLGTLGVLLAGMIGMVRGADPHRSNRLMRWRVILQGAALLLLALMMTLLRS
jgi:hypothetical protein